MTYSIILSLFIDYRNENYKGPMKQYDDENKIRFSNIQNDINDLKKEIKEIKEKL